MTGQPTTLPFILERDEREIRIGDRRFRLVEMSAADQRRFVQMQLEPVERVIAEMRDLPEQPADSPQGPRIVQAMEKWTAANEPLLLWLLRNPVDGGPPADAALLAEITDRQRVQIIQIQDELNDSQAVLGNAVRLLTQAEARRKKDELLISAGPTSSESSRGTSAP